MKKLKKVIDAYCKALVYVASYTRDAYRDLSKICSYQPTLHPFPHNIELCVSLDNEHFDWLYFTSPKWVTFEGAPIFISVHIEKKTLVFTKIGGMPNVDVPNAIQSDIKDCLAILSTYSEKIVASIIEKIEIEKSTELCREFGLDGNSSYYKLLEA